MSARVVFVNKLGVNQEIEDKIEILAQEEGSGDIKFVVLNTGIVVGSAMFPLRSDAESFKKKINSFAGISAGILDQ